MIYTLGGCFLAACTGFLLFSHWVSLPLSLWPALSLAYALLGLYALPYLRTVRHQLLWFENRWLSIGIVAALVLYALSFAVTSIISPLSPLIHNDYAALYQTKTGVSNILIGTLLLFWITPLTELFWRGFVQHRLMQHYGKTGGWLLTSALYALVHIWAGNVAGFLLLFLTGIGYGWLFARYQRLWPSLIAQAVWNVLAVIVLPLPYR